MLAFVAHARNPTPGLINFAGNVSTHMRILCSMLDPIGIAYCSSNDNIFFLQPTGTAHYVIGIVVMLLHIINVRTTMTWCVCLLVVA